MRNTNQSSDVMSATDDGFDGMLEECPSCGHETPHEVSVEIMTESSSPKNAEYSREPYRVSECQVCGTESALRMNNA